MVASIPGNGLSSPGQSYVQPQPRGRIVGIMSYPTCSDFEKSSGTDGKVGKLWSIFRTVQRERTGSVYCWRSHSPYPIALS